MQNLRLKRIAAGFTQSDLARRVIRSQSWLSDVEKGKITPSFADAVVISRYLSTDVKDLFPSVADKSYEEKRADLDKRGRELRRKRRRLYRKKYGTSLPRPLDEVTAEKRALFMDKLVGHLKESE